jgi:hypothetical protein
MKLQQRFGRGKKRPPAQRQVKVRLGLEHLEDRTLPSSYTAASVSDLIADINAANQAGGANTITLKAGKELTLTAVITTTDGATGLPVIAAGDSLTIIGNGDTLAQHGRRNAGFPPAGRGGRGATTPGKTGGIGSAARQLILCPC